jgi:hypothetical protein
MNQWVIVKGQQTYSDAQAPIQSHSRPSRRAPPQGQGTSTRSGAVANYLQAWFRPHWQLPLSIAAFRGGGLPLSEAIYANARGV